MSEIQNMKDLVQINKSNTRNTNMRPNTFKNIAISLETYLQLKRLGQTADSFNDVITNLISEHYGDRKETSESGSGLVTRDQIPTTITTNGMGDKRE